MLKFRLHIIYICIAAILLAACKADDERAAGVISPDKMEDVLYDYHLLQAVAASTADADTLEESTNEELSSLNAQLFKKHGISEKQFNQSLEYYSRHIDQFYDIYDRLTARFEQAGGAGGGVPHATAASLSTDTLQLYALERPVLLSATAQNRFVQDFGESVDSFHLQKGDRLVFSFDTRWIYQSGSKTAFAQISLRYQGDSIASFTKQIHSTGHQEVQINVGTERPVERIAVFIYQNAQPAPKPRFLLLSNIALTLQRSKPVETDSLHSALGDSARVDSLPANAERQVRDSLLQADHTRPHTTPAAANDERLVAPDGPLQMRRHTLKK